MTSSFSPAQTQVILPSLSTISAPRTARAAQAAGPTAADHNPDRTVIPSVNGIALHSTDEAPGIEELRRRACIELLRQAAIRDGLLAADDPAPVAGATTQAASDAIEALIEHQVQGDTPDEDACRRFYQGHSSRFAHGERVHLRHVLFAVTQGVDVNALRKRAEACLLDLRCETSATSTRFAEVAASTSNCPSGATGGDLGWLETADCAPEFAREIFGKLDSGVLPRLVHSRFGLHVIEVLARAPGLVPDFEYVRPAVAHELERQRFTTILRQYLQLLAGQADLIGIDLDASATPLVQ